MFYADKEDPTLRFGDVIKGFVLAASNVIDAGHVPKFEIYVNIPTLCVVLSPCCSIGDKLISLTPLLPIRNSFYDNPYFAEDFTRINRKMLPQQAVSPRIWGSLGPEEQTKRLGEGEGYALVELFVYEKHDKLPEYTVDRREGKIETRNHMIDFRNSFKINCEKIISPMDAPVHQKVLQLSIKARSELREKIANFFGRIPVEDLTGDD